MKRMLLILLCAASPALADREALTAPLPGLNASEQERFLRRRSLFRQSWVIAPARDRTVDGLGPLYNRIACISCHPKNGRGGAPEGPDQRMQTMLVRLSVPGTPPQAHPVYGDQLNEEGIPGVPGEGRAEVHWQTRQVTLADGHRVELRFPELRFVDLAYGELGPILVSPRVGPPVAGLGLLDAVDARTLAAMAREAKPDGVRGQVNRIGPGKRPGRFGLKANTSDLRSQIAGAFHGDMSITSPLFPAENCTPAQTACRRAKNGGRPELSAVSWPTSLSTSPTWRRPRDATPGRRRSCAAARNSPPSAAPFATGPACTPAGARSACSTGAASRPTPTCWCTTWAPDWPTAAPTTPPAAANGAPLRCGASACWRQSTKTSVISTTAAPVPLKKPSSGMAAKAKRHAGATPTPMPRRAAT